MAEISPICSIIVASAIGAITKMAEISNLARKKGGIPTQFAEAIFEYTMSGEPSAAVTPML